MTDWFWSCCCCWCWRCSTLLVDILCASIIWLQCQFWSWCWFICWRWWSILVNTFGSWNIWFRNWFRCRFSRWAWMTSPKTTVHPTIQRAWLLNPKTTISKQLSLKILHLMMISLTATSDLQPTAFKKHWRPWQLGWACPTTNLEPTISLDIAFNKAMNYWSKFRRRSACFELSTASSLTYAPWAKNKSNETKGARANCVWLPELEWIRTDHIYKLIPIAASICI